MEKLLPMITYLKNIEACVNIGITKIQTLANKIYSSGKIPQQMKGHFYNIAKERNLLNCNNYRLNSLMSHITKKYIACNSDKNDKRFRFKKSKEMLYFHKRKLKIMCFGKKHIIS